MRRFEDDALLFNKGEIELEDGEWLDLECLICDAGGAGYDWADNHLKHHHHLKLWASPGEVAWRVKQRVLR